MAKVRNKRRLAAVSRETPEGSRNSRAQNVLDPELTQDYISQVSEEIEGRVTKNLSKEEFSKTESRILGALSKIDEFVLNPQVRTCSVAVPGTSRNNNSENRETTGDRSSDDHYPEVGYFSHHSGHLNSPERENNPDMVTRATEEISHYTHMMTTTQDEIPYCSPSTSSANKRRRAPQLSHNFAVSKPLQQLKQTRFCRRRTAIQPSSTTTSVESRNCLNPSQVQCPHLMENQRNSKCLKICSKQVWKSPISWRRKTKRTTSTLSRLVMLYKLSKTSLAPTERNWEKSWLCSIGNTWNPSQWLRQNINFNDCSSIQQPRS